MSTTGRTSDGGTERLEELPLFELSYLFDEEHDPETVTIFQPGTDIRAATQWMTVESNFAVPLEEIR